MEVGVRELKDFELDQDLVQRAVALALAYGLRSTRSTGPPP